MKLGFRTRKYIVRELEQGIPARVLAQHFGVSKRHVNRLARMSDLALKPVGRPRNQYPQQAIDLVVKLKKERGWGVHKITFMLKRDHGVRLSHNAVHRILSERGEIKQHPEKGFRYTYIRYERHHSNSMWQTDWKWLSDEECWLTAYLDDHSRFVVGASKFTEATTTNTLELFHQSAGKHGYPKQVLTDHGTQYWKQSGSKYTKELKKSGVKHILGRIKKPTTTGKIERWWLTYIHESTPYKTLPDFLHYYNHQRSHQSLGYQTPATIYHQDLSGT